MTSNEIFLVDPEVNQVIRVYLKMGRNVDTCVTDSSTVNIKFQPGHHNST